MRITRTSTNKYNLIQWFPCTHNTTAANIRRKRKYFVILLLCFFNAQLNATHIISEQVTQYPNMFKQTNSHTYATNHIGVWLLSYVFVF